MIRFHLHFAMNREWTKEPFLIRRFKKSIAN